MAAKPIDEMTLAELTEAKSAYAMTDRNLLYTGFATIMSGVALAIAIGMIFGLALLMLGLVQLVIRRNRQPERDRLDQAIARAQK